jgi:GPI mannosyltransferase 2
MKHNINTIINNTNTNNKTILFYAIISRLIVVYLSSFTGWIISDYDTSTNILKEGSVPIASRFIKWDAVYFAHIAQNGYECEQFHAFFPLLPWLVHALSRGMWMMNESRRS